MQICLALAPDAIIELFEAALRQHAARQHRHLALARRVNADVTGKHHLEQQRLRPSACAGGGFEYTNGGTLPRPTLSVANLDGAITALLIGVNLTTPGNDLTGAKVKRIRTLKSFSMVSLLLILTQRFLLKSGLLIVRPLNHGMLSALSWPANLTCQTNSCPIVRWLPTFANGSTAVPNVATQAATTLT